MIIVVIGPTGIGKTKLSLALAKHYNSEIISGDSVQVYKGLDIGSAKIKDSEMNGIKHHLIDILEPTEDFSVALFQTIVREKIKELADKDLNPIIVGGTGLYIKSVLYDYNFSNSSRDRSLDELYKDVSNEDLHNILKEKDYEASLNIHMNNRKRVLQAISRSKDNKVSDNKNKDVPLYDFKIIGLTLDRSLLYEIINKRVDLMVEDGLVEEVKGLYDKGIKSNSVSAIGYKELYTYFDGVYSLEEAINKIKQHSRNLAKKQLTFFHNQFDVTWVNVDINNFDNTINEVINLLDK
jgi:tRNA dimethylallyltransferase